MDNKNIKILFIGDIVGRPGRNACKKLIPELVEKHQVDFVIANGENLASGSGMTHDTYKDMISSGIDYFTSGNHIWKNKDIIEHLNNDETKILRPLNYSPDAPGRGSAILEKGEKKFCLINAQGRVFMPDDIDDPFISVERYIEDKCDLPVVIDFHAEATSEKVAFGWYLDGKAAAVVGTHTHVQTADETILPKGTGYITDVGMVGPIVSVLGVEKEIIIGKFLTQLPASHKVAIGDVNFSALLIEIDPERKITTSISRINELVESD